MPLYSTACPLPLNRKIFRHKGSVSSIPTTGLSLWLKADAGVSKFSFNYVSQIIISGTSTPNLNGTYTATSVPSYDFGNGIPSNYSFSGPSNGFGMYFDGGYFYMLKNIGDGDAILESSNGQTWTITSQAVNQVVISGFTGDYAGANGSYNYSSDYNAFLNGDETYVIEGSELKNIETQEVLATNTNTNYSGSWTLVNGTGNPVTTSVIIIPTGSISGSTTTSTVNTNFVTAWADQSGIGNNAGIESYAQEPTFVSSFLNGKPAVEFNGQGQVMKIEDEDSLDFLNMSCFIVLKYLGEGTGNNIVYMKNADDGSPENPSVYGMVGTLGIFGGNLDWPVSSAGNPWPDLDSNINITDGTPRLLSMTYNGTDIITYDAGVQTSSNELGGNMLTSTGLLQIGGYNHSFDSAEYFYGQIAEIIMYNRAVNGTERQQVEAYLNTKYAIY